MSERIRRITIKGETRIGVSLTEQEAQVLRDLTSVGSSYEGADEPHNVIVTTLFKLFDQVCPNIEYEFESVDSEPFCAYHTRKIGS